MKKMIALALVLMISAFALTACTGMDEPAAPQTPTTAPAAATAEPVATSAPMEATDAPAATDMPAATNAATTEPVA